MKKEYKPISHIYVWRSLAGVALVLVLALPLTALAHEAVDIGNYHYEIGWVNEPVTVGERNALFLFVAPKDKPDQGLAGVEATLKFTVEYGGVSQSYDLVPVENEPGQYTAVFIPTRLGQYTFHITGQIQNEAVDVSVKPEEVAEVGKLAFPVAQPTVGDLQAQLAAAQSQSTTTLYAAIAGLVFGVLGLGVALVAILKKK
jgi:hypothetical protein